MSIMRRWRSAALGERKHANVDRDPDDLQFEMHDLLEQDSEGERSFDVQNSNDPSTPGREGAFDTGTLERFYQPIESYEGRHRYDPDFRWSTAIEKRVVRKIDFSIGCLVCLMFFALQVDRGNIVNSLSADILNDLGITSREYNTGQTLYFLSFLFAEIPSQLIAKRLGPDRWMPLQMIAWSIVASMQAGISGRWSFWVTRAFIGLFEAGFVPSVVLYLSYFYTSAELPLRLSWFWASYQVTSIVSGSVAYSLLHMSGLYDIPGWRWLFGCEGAMTCIIGCIAWLHLPRSPTQTATRICGAQSWFTVTEEKIMVNRILRDDPSKGDMHDREALTPSLVWQCLCDYHMWPIYLLGLSWQLPVVPNSQHLTINLRTLSLGNFEVVMFTLPAYILWVINLLAFTFISGWINERLLTSTVSQIWCLPMLMVLETLQVKNREGMHTYVLTMLLFAQPYIHAILIGLASRNSGSVRTRTVSAALYNMCVQASNVMGSFIYQVDDAPIYVRGNKILIIIAGYNFFLLIWCKWYYVSANQQREVVWEAMSKQEKQAYLATTKDEGNKRLDFRFVH